MPDQEPPFTLFGLPLQGVSRLSFQRLFTLFLVYTFINNPDYRLHTVVLALVTLFAVRRQQYE